MKRYAEGAWAQGGVANGRRGGWEAVSVDLGLSVFAAGECECRAQG